MMFTTADLVDAHEELQSCDLQFRSFGKRQRFSGTISTVRCRHDNALVKRVLSQPGVGSVPGAGSVLVIDGDGSMHCALVGDVIAGMAGANGLAGIVGCGPNPDSAAKATFELGGKALWCNPPKSR